MAAAGEESGIPYCHKAIHIIVLLLTAAGGLKQGNNTEWFCEVQYIFREVKYEEKCNKKSSGRSPVSKYDVWINRLWRQWEF